MTVHRTGPQRVMYAIGALVSGGAERQLWLLLRDLDRDAWSPHLIAYADGRWRGRFEALEIPVEVIGATGWDGLAATYRRLRQVHPALLHTYGHTANYLGRMAAIGARVPVVISERSAPAIKPARLRVLERALGPHTTYLISNSDHAARYYATHRFISRDKIAVVRNGIERSISAPARPDARARPSRLVTITDFRPVKHHVALLRAARVLMSAHPETEVRFIGDGPGRAQAERDAARLGVADHTVFRGYVDDVATELEGASVYVHPSRYEGQPNGVLEAMAAGLPCVTFDSPGCAELVEHNRTGLIVPMDEYRALAVAMASLLAHPERGRTMGEAGRQVVAEHFGVASMVAGTTAVYHRVLGSEVSAVAAYG